MRTLGKVFLYLLEPFWYGALHYWSHKKSIAALRSAVSGKQVVIIGSGSSAQEITPIVNSEVVFACCNFSSNFLPQGSTASLYMTTSYAIQERPSLIQECLDNQEYRWIGINDSSIIPQKHQPHTHTRQARNVLPFAKILSLKPLLRQRVSLMRQGQYYFFSTGVQLVGLCLLAGAREIYVAGIDIDTEITYAHGEKYETDPHAKANKHNVADLYFMKQVVQRNLPVYSLVSSSPVCQILPHKTLL